MPRRVFVYRDEKFVEVTDRETKPSVHIIQDSMPDTWHPADGKYYSSKSGFRETTKAHGLVEYGNEDPRKCAGSRPTLDREQRKRDIARAYDQVVNGNRR